MSYLPWEFNSRKALRSSRNTVHICETGKRSFQKTWISKGKDYQEHFSSLKVSFPVHWEENFLQVSKARESQAIQVILKTSLFSRPFDGRTSGALTCQRANGNKEMELTSLTLKLEHTHTWKCTFWLALSFLLGFTSIQYGFNQF